MPNILLMGPIPPPYTGQSVAFSPIVVHYRKNPLIHSIEINLSNRNGFWTGITLLIQILFILTFKRINLIYFTCSRSFLGSARDIVLLILAKIFNIRVINHLHGNDFKYFYTNSSWIYKKILKWCYKGVDTSIVLLNGMKELFDDFPDMKIKVVANSYSALLDKLPHEKLSQNKCIEFLYLSNIMESKGILNLLEAFELILRNNLDCKLTIAGTYIGDYIAKEHEIKHKFDNLYNKIKKKFEIHIEYIGVVEGQAKNELLYRSDIFVLPTYHKTESFPISILEAMRGGCYIISTNHNYIPQIVSSKNGELVTPNSVSSLQKAMEKIIKDRFSLNQVQNYNIKHAISNYSEDKYINEVTRIIDAHLPNNSHI